MQAATTVKKNRSIDVKGVIRREPSHEKTPAGRNELNFIVVVSQQYKLSNTVRLSRCCFSEWIPAFLSLGMVSPPIPSCKNKNKI